MNTQEKQTNKTHSTDNSVVGTRGKQDWGGASKGYMGANTW